VTINYRLGALGFLAQPALASHPGGSSGNYGLMDQQAPLAAAEAAGKAFATKVGCASQTAACLRSLPVSTIVDNEDFAGYQPDIDGTVLTQSIGPALASGQFSRVPVINGTNRDEWRLFIAQAQLDGAPPVTAANYQANIESTLGVSAADAAVIAARYPLSAYPSAPVALGAVGTDAIFACPALTVDTSLSRYVPTYAYEFNDQNAPERYLPPVGFRYGAAHESEVQYLFSLRNTAFPGALTRQQRQLAAAMKQYWTNLAKGASPAPPGEPLWPRFEPTSQQILSLVPPQPQIETSFAAEHHCAFWARAS
jgi:para-nitrobenzyl esterase